MVWWDDNDLFWTAQWWLACGYSIWDGFAQNDGNLEASLWMIPMPFKGASCGIMLKTHNRDADRNWMNQCGWDSCVWIMKCLKPQLWPSPTETAGNMMYQAWNYNELHKTKVNHVAVWAVPSKQRALQPWSWDWMVKHTVAWITGYWIRSMVRLNNHICLWASEEPFLFSRIWPSIVA